MVSFLTGLLSAAWKKLATFLVEYLNSGVALLVVAVACFALGYIKAYQSGEYKLAEYQLEIDKQVAAIKAVNAQKIVEAQNEIQQKAAGYERTITLLNDVASDISKRVRVQASSGSGRTAKASGRMDESSNAECRKLLSEGVSLLAEGAGILGKNALIHDAVIKARE